MLAILLPLLVVGNYRKKPGLAALTYNCQLVLPPYNRTRPIRKLMPMAPVDFGIALSPGPA